MQEVELFLCRTISAVVKIPEGGFSKNDDLIAKHGMDSMQRIEILIAIEKRFGISVPDDEAQKIRSLADFVGVVERLVESAKGEN